MVRSGLHGGAGAALRKWAEAQGLPPFAIGDYNFDYDFHTMADINGDRLCENLGASQVRRRLKGHGFGVRKDRAAIESKLPYPRRSMYPLTLANVRF